ncbi:MAG: PspC domain-containing protein [Bacillota bacterium]
MRRLYRSRHERVIAGVAGGIAEYFNVDVTLIRLIWVVAIFAGGSGLIAYIVAALIIPEEPYGYVPEPNGRTAENSEAAGSGTPTPGQPTTGHGHARPDRTTAGTTAVFGWVLLGLGLLFLLRNFIPWFSWGLFWPLILVGFGVYILYSATRGDHR